VSVRITPRGLSVAAAYRELEDAESGGVVLFLGRTRPDRNRGGRVVRLDYEADPEMARASLEKLARYGRARFGARRVVLWHRVGAVPVGAVSVIVGVAAPHRADAFAAARYLIDALKRSSPIWKAERRARPGRRPRARRSRRRGRSAG
jgi:molybdopterin synthase catalytic subunit